MKFGKSHPDWATPATLLGIERAGRQYFLRVDNLLYPVTITEPQFPPT